MLGSRITSAFWPEESEATLDPDVCWALVTLAGLWDNAALGLSEQGKEGRGWELPLPFQQEQLLQSVWIARLALPQMACELLVTQAVNTSLGIQDGIFWRTLWRPNSVPLKTGGDTCIDFCWKCFFGGRKILVSNLSVFVVLVDKIEVQNAGV